jgi:6-phosphofructo-2-kinase/fructose-2,6-biphosphatase
VQAVLRVIFGYLMAQNQQAIPSISIPLHTVIELTPRPDGTMGIDYIPVPVHLSDASMLTTSMEALPASAAAAVQAAAATAAVGSKGGGSSGGESPLNPANMMGLDPAAVAAVGACPFKQDEQQGPAAEVAAAAMRRPHGSMLATTAGADAAVLIGDGGDNSSSSTGTGCGLQAHEEHAESMPCYYYVEAKDTVGELPQLNREEIQRMSSCSSGSSLALMQQFTAAAAAATAAAPLGCVDQ